MRKTIRLDQKKIEQLIEWLNEDDVSKAVDFALTTAINHINFVTMAFVPPDYDVIFQKKRKTQQLKRRIYQ